MAKSVLENLVSAYALVGHAQGDAPAIVPLTASEVWIPRPGPEDITARFRGIDVFTTPARQLLEQIESMGFSVLHREPNHPLVLNLSLGFTRGAGHEVPLDTDGQPLYFQAVLVGPENYYARLRERLQL